MFTRAIALSLTFLNLALMPSPGSAQTEVANSPQWLIVTTTELAAACAPLTDLRAQQGYKVQQLVGKSDRTNQDWTSKSIEGWVREQREKHIGSTIVLLVGDWNAKNEEAYLPSCLGNRGRMSGKITDHGYGLPVNDGVPTIAVGRIPARTAKEAVEFVEKIRRFEDQGAGPWTNRLNLWVGHPGGNSALEKRLGEMIIQTAVNKSLTRLNSMWSRECLIDFPNTPYSVDRLTFRNRLHSDLTKGHCFTIYAGHSAAQGVWSEDQYVFPNRDWSELKIESSPGVILTTGCFACQVVGAGGEGYLTTAVRNSDGPVACIGAFAESYAAHGQLALDAFVELTSLQSPPCRLGDYWLRMLQGIGRGKMDPLTFWLYDQADGSHGQVPLEMQRLEHLEMWTLLGDPGLKIPFLLPSVELTIEAMIGSSEITVQFDVPPDFADAQVEIQALLRPTLGNLKARDSAAKQPPQPDEPFRYRVNKTGFKETLTLPEPLADGKLEIRMMLIKEGKGALGTHSIVLKSRAR